MAQLNTFHLFAGAGGGILGDVLLGHNPIGACEIEPYPRDVLLARQADGHLPDFPIWDDVATLDGNPWRGSVDVLCGGFPCQDISSAGKGAGITGERSGLWKEYARLIGEMRPRFVFAENSPLLRTRGLGVVLEDLAALGYNARWGIIGAGAVGAPHKRDRMWVLAHTRSTGTRHTDRKTGDKNGRTSGEHVQTLRQAHGKNGSDRVEPTSKSESNLAYANNDGNTTTEESEGTTQGSDTGQTRAQPTSESAGLCASRADGSMGWIADPAEVFDTTSQRGCGRDSSGEDAEDAGQLGSGEGENSSGMEEGNIKPLVGRVAHGVANRVDRLKAIGNGQVPQCAAVAFSILSEGLI